MKRLHSRPVFALAIVLALSTSGCSMSSIKARFGNSPMPLSDYNPAPGEGGNTVQTLPFQVGISSTTVEKLAKENSCFSKKGAGLLTPVGPTEVYRVACEDGRIVLASCELRQCKLTSGVR